MRKSTSRWYGQLATPSLSINCFVSRTSHFQTNILDGFWSVFMSSLFIAPWPDRRMLRNYLIQYPLAESILVSLDFVLSWQRSAQPSNMWDCGFRITNSNCSKRWSLATIYTCHRRRGLSHSFIRRNGWVYRTSSFRIAPCGNDHKRMVELIPSNRCYAQLICVISRSLQPCPLQPDSMKHQMPEAFISNALGSLVLTQ